MCTCNGSVIPYVNFEDYKNGTPVPSREDALENIKTCTCVPELFSNVKAALLKTESKEVYSTEEEEIGIWIDGRTLYRKVFSGMTANDSATAINFADVAELDIDTAVRIYGKVVVNNTTYMIPFMFAGSSGNVVLQFNIFYNDNNKMIQYGMMGSNFYTKPMHVIIEYTKA